MSTEFRLPGVTEDITEVTILEWRVKEGDAVKKGDIIVVIGTDKVDQEIESPADGVILKLSASRNALVPASSVLAIIGQPGESVTAPNAAPMAAPAGASAPSTPSEAEIRATPVAEKAAKALGVALQDVTGTGRGGRITREDVESAAKRPAVPTPTPLVQPSDFAEVADLTVRRLAADYNLNLSEIAQGRPLSTLTRYDVLAAAGVAVEQTFLAPSGWSPAAAPSVQPSPALQPAAPASTAKLPTPSPSSAAPSDTTLSSNGLEELVSHTRMRAAVAKNTVYSAFSTPHVTTMWDVEMTAVLAHRSAHKAEFTAAGVNLTVTAYLIQAIVAGLKAVPAANATWRDEGVLIRRYYNIGMAVALPTDAYGMGGLIVPVIKNAGDLNLLGLARIINDLAERARKNKLKPEDLNEGTFTLSNYGTSGSRFQTPIIVQPQVGILGVGAIEKRPIVVSAGHPLEANSGDYLSFRPMTTLGFSYDHRVLDGATADAFCKVVKETLENYR